MDETTADSNRAVGKGQCQPKPGLIVRGRRGGGGHEANDINKEVASIARQQNQHGTASKGLSAIAVWGTVASKVCTPTYVSTSARNAAGKLMA